MVIVKRLVACVAGFFALAHVALAAPQGVGFGIVLGEPTGLSVKKWLNDRNAIDGAAAWSLSGNEAFQIHGDYLFHAYDVFKPKGIDGKLPLYYGLGGRLKFNDLRDGKKETRLGVRFPVGITYLRNGAPFDLFLELVPVLDLAPSTAVRLGLAVGGRYYFK
jgi:hypothetical protein